MVDSGLISGDHGILIPQNWHSFSRTTSASQIMLIDGSRQFISPIRTSQVQLLPATSRDLTTVHSKFCPDLRMKLSSCTNRSARSRIQRTSPCSTRTGETGNTKPSTFFAYWIEQLSTPGEGDGFWPNITCELREKIPKSHICNTFRDLLPKNHWHPFHPPSGQWERVAVDIFTFQKRECLQQIFFRDISR